MRNNLDLLLVNIGGIEKIYQDLSKDLSAIEPPFWAALTAGFIRNKGFCVKILDANAENLNIEETAEKIKDYEPRLTNIIVYGQHPSASTQLMDGVGKLCKEIKKRNKDLKIILTGLHPSALPKRTITEEQCDFVGQGEGFYTLLGLLENKNLKEILGLWWKQKNNIFNNPRAKNIENLTSELKDVAWDLLPMDKYKAHNWQCLDDLNSRLRYASISTSLGCPFQCKFCAIHATFGERRIRYWDSEWVIKQIDDLVKNYNIKNLKIIDEMFILNPKHFMGIADKLIERKYDLNIWVYARVDTVKQEYLEKLRKAGFKWFALGIESGSENIRGIVSKGKFNQIDIWNTVKKIKNSGINVLGNFIFGLSGDNLESMQKTLDLAIDLNCEWANFYCAVAWPGSELYNQAVSKGIKLPDSWIGYSPYSYECQPLPTNKVSAEEVLRFRDNSFKAYFTNQTYLNMIEKKFGKKAKKHIEEMTKIKLKRKILRD